MNIADALKEVRQLFLDTAPVIYHIEGIAAYQPLTDFVFQQISNGTFEATTTPITLAECLVHPFQKQDTAMVHLFRQVITAGDHTRYMSLDAAATKFARPDAEKISAWLEDYSLGEIWEKNNST